MALKSKLTKAEFDALPDVLKEHYKASGDSYVLDADDANELRNALDKERRDREAAQTAATEAQRRLDEAAAARQAEAEELARKNKDITSLEASWQAKVDAEKAKGETTATGLRAQLTNLLVDNKALEIANKISKSPKLILPHIKSRLRAELDGGNTVTRVLDASGQPTALTLADLEAELIANPDFVDIIKATNANGGGAANNGGSGGGATNDLSKMNDTERKAWHARDPVGFNAAVQASKVTN